MSLISVKNAIEDIKQGKMVVMVDDEDRENEGDLVYASIFSTPEKVNFMITHAKGLVCMSVNEKNADRLQLSPMVRDNDSIHETAFTVSVDARVAKTGVSAGERDMTIKIISDYTSHAKDLVRPGHIFPLIAKKGGVLVRTGHTEGSIDLCRLAGLSESAVICEIIKSDGEMARRCDLDIFCKKHDLRIVSIADIVKYRMQNELLIREIAMASVDFLGTQAKRYDFLDHLENHQIAYVFGDISEITAIKFHNIMQDIELLTSNKKFTNLMNSIDYLKKNSGILIFLSSESSQSIAIKDYGTGAQILNYLGVKKINLLVTQGKKEFVGIKGFGLDVSKETTI